LTKKTIEQPDEILISEQEVYDVLKFARELGYNNAILNPFLINSRLKEINLNPVQATEATLTQALNNPRDSEILLQEFSQDFEIQSQIYKKLLEYLGNLLSFDFTYECVNISKPDEYKSVAYRKDLDIFKKFHDNFDHKKYFTDVVGEVLRNEAAFYCPRFDGDSLVLQELPASPQWTMITGRWKFGYEFDMNLLWFINPGVDIKMYPDFFRKKYVELWGDGKTNKYIPSASPSLRDGNYVYWQQVPCDVGWVFKLNQASGTRIPHFSGLFLDLIQQPLMRALQKNINLSAAAKLLVGGIGTQKEAQAKVKDQFNINPDTLGKFLSVVKAAVGESIRVAVAPLENLKAVSFESDNALYNSTLKTTLASSGVNTGLIFTSDVKQNSLESQLSTNVDEQLMYSLYPQFENFYNYQLNKLTKHYKFKVKFEGSQFFTDKQQRLDTQMTLLASGIVLPQKIAAACNMSPFSFQRQLEEAQATDWTLKLTPIVPAAQMAGGEEKTGRPKKKDGSLSDSGTQTRDDASNVNKNK
jgi:hypothetical protein